ncbi:hypothetical protein EBR96_07035, partial [bacterium]|nr:hypothetical protein [bacterium]
MIEKIKNMTRTALMMGLLSLVPLESESQTSTVESRPLTMTEKVNEAARLSRSINGILAHYGKESFTYTDPVTHASITFSLKNAPSGSIQEEHLVRSMPSATLSFTADAGAGLFKEVDIVSKKNTPNPEINKIRVNTKYHKIITPEGAKKYSEQENHLLLEGYSARFIKEYQAMLKAIEDTTHTTEQQAAVYAQAIESHMAPPAQRHETTAFVAGTLGEAASTLIQVLG